MVIDRLKDYNNTDTLKQPLIGSEVQQEKIIQIISITQINERQSADNKKEYELMQSDEIFICLVSVLQDVKQVKKIIISILKPDNLTCFIVVKEDNEKIRKDIYKKEQEIIEYLANFEYEVDFHIIPEELVDDIMDENCKTIYP